MYLVKSLLRLDAGGLTRPSTCSESRACAHPSPGTGHQAPGATMRARPDVCRSWGGRLADGEDGRLCHVPRMPPMPDLPGGPRMSWFVILMPCPYRWTAEQPSADRVRVPPVAVTRCGSCHISMRKTKTLPPPMPTREDPRTRPQILASTPGTATVCAKTAS